MKTKLAICLLAASVTLTCIAGEKYYKWVDADGVTHYTLQEPANQAAETVQVSKSPSSHAATGVKTDDKAKSAAAGDADAPPSAESEQTPEQAAQVAAKRAENCAAARRNMETLEVHARVMIMDEKTGENRYISEDEHAQWRTDSERQIAAFCD